MRKMTKEKPVKLSKYCEHLSENTILIRSTHFYSTLLKPNHWFLGCLSGNNVLQIFFFCVYSKNSARAPHIFIFIKTGSRVKKILKCYIPAQQSYNRVLLTFWCFNADKYIVRNDTEFTRMFSLKTLKKCFRKLKFPCCQYPYSWQ